MNPLPSVEKLTDAANANLQMFQAYAEISLSAAERLTTLNMDAARSMFAYATANATPMLGEDMRDQIASRFSSQGQNLEKVAEYIRNLNEVVVKTQTDVAHLGAKRISELTEALHAVLDNLAKNGPAGTTEIVAALKSALNTAATTYENMIETAREVTETNLTAAADALHSTASEAAHSAKSASKKAA